MDLESHNATTITILDGSLSLVHIPRSRLTELNRPILKQLLRKSPKFLNLTANEIELSIFAEDDELSDFEPIARRDRQKRLRDSASASGRHRRRRPSNSHDVFESVEISFEKWKVLQIDFHDDNLSSSGSRVRELSAPLAAAGISILYQSSYLSDFIVVKASRLAEVMTLLGDEGFTLYNADPYQVASNPLPTSSDMINEGYYDRLQSEINGNAVSQPGSPAAMSPAVFSRTRSPSVASLVALSNAISKQGTVENSAPVTLKSKTSGSPLNSSTTSLASRTPKKSLSPAAAPVEVLAPDLACVGLNESASDIWIVKILTLVGYPELIPTPKIDLPSSSSRVLYDDERRNSLADSLYGSASNVSRRRLSSPVAGPLSPSAVFSHDFEGSDVRDDDEIVRSRPGSSSSVNPSSRSDSDSEEYFSSSSPYNRSRAGASLTPSLSETSQSSARSLPEHLEDFQKSEQPHLSRFSTVAPPRRSDSSSADCTNARRYRTDNLDKLVNGGPLGVSFFSFTRTAEGSSLTTDIRILSALFGLDERHMVICSSSLLEAGDELNARAAVEQEFGTSEKRPAFDLDGDGLFEEKEPALGTMKCLQIDLQKYGLDKYGLVNRFSRVLAENGVKHMYSSTYKTANLLVDKANAFRARALLRCC